MIDRTARAWWQVAKGRQVSGFTRDRYWYGGLLVYEPLDSKWRRYHARFRQPGCTGYWLDHALNVTGTPGESRLVRDRARHRA